MYQHQVGVYHNNKATIEMDTTNVVGLGEVWKDIPGYEGVYQASSLGQIRSIPRNHTTKVNKKLFYKGKLLKFTQNHRGYLYVTICLHAYQKVFSAHKLVAMAFIGPRPEGLIINHINGIKTDNRPENLEYITYSENLYHAVALGNFPIGERNAATKLTSDQVREIKRQRSLNPISYRALARQYKVAVATVCDIALGKTWKHIQ